MGKNGSKAFYNGKSVFCEPFLRDDTIETTGAGDTFMACVLNAVLEKGLEALSEGFVRDASVCKCGGIHCDNKKRSIESNAGA